MVNFNDVLDTDTSTVERPPLLPIGTYRVAVSKVPVMDTIAQDAFDVVDFPMSVKEAMEDVDQDDLAAYGNYQNAPLRHRFMFDKEDETKFARSEYNLKRFLTEHLNLPDGPFKELLSNSVGQECLVQVRWRADKNDPEIQYVEVARTAPLE